MDKPVLSIGIIFRNNIRSIERCLKALRPLRDAVPSELVMADTGSNDGSRAVAEKYADILFDFPWINDFSAARNAVIDRSSGEWYFTVDSDEYLDGDISELVDFLRMDDPSRNLCRVNQRNYHSYEMDGVYSDFFALRLVRLSTGTRYEGAIHEMWAGIDNYGTIFQLSHTILHHDGYVNMNQNAEKLARNMSLLRQKMRKEPQNLLIRLQVIESGVQEEDYVEQIRKAVTLVKRKPDQWEFFGPPIFRYAVAVAREQNLPEFEKWADMAEEWFPDAYYTRIDVAARRALAAFDKGEHKECVRRCEDLMNAYEDYRAGRGDLGCQAYSTLQLASSYHEQVFRLLMAISCLAEEMPERARDLLSKVDCSLLTGDQMDNLAKALCLLRSKSDLDTDELILYVWEGITAPKPNAQRAEERRLSFMLTGSSAFTSTYRREETQKGQHHAYPLFAPLAGKCGLGTAAAIMESEDPAEILTLLNGVEKWNELPFPAVSHAIKQGVPFPLPDKPQDVEAMDGMAKRLAGDWDELFLLVELAMKKEQASNWQEAVWTRAMVLAAVLGFGWRDEQKGMALARAFVRAEREFNSLCCTPEVLCEEHIFALPSMHRFGWYCTQAFDALERGDPAGYAASLRKGLATCESMKPMVEFLVEHTPALAPPPPSAELLALAGQVRNLLAMYPEDDPAVEALKASAAYQKVAHLIEGTPAPVFGGLPQ